jgi:regulator of sigma E protease
MMAIIWAVILFGVLVFVHELGHFIFAKLMNVKVLKFSLGFGPKVLGKKVGETEYIISAVPLGGYVKMLGEDAGEAEIPEEEKKRTFNNQSISKRFLIVFSGPVFNLGLTYVIFVSFLSAGLPVNLIKLETSTTRIEEVVKNSPAEKAGLEVGDTVVSVEGREVFTWFDMAETIRKNPGRPIEIKAEREGKVLSFGVLPEAFKAMDAEGKEVTIGRIGINKSDVAFDVIKSRTIMDAPLKGFEATYKMGIFILKVVKGLVTGTLSFKMVGGPILIFEESGKAASAGLLPYLMLIAILSANLGVLNLLPIPILDGGLILFLAIEALKGKPLSEKALMISQKIGIVIIIVLMTLAFYNDITRVFISNPGP